MFGKSGSLNLLQPKGTVQTCTGIAFTFYQSVKLLLGPRERLSQCLFPQDVKLTTCPPPIVYRLQREWKFTLILNVHKGFTFYLLSWEFTFLVALYIQSKC